MSHHDIGDGTLEPGGTAQPPLVKYRLSIALVCFAAGIFPVLAAFDVGPLNQEDIYGPPWIGFAAGGAFVLAGVALLFADAARFRWIGGAATVAILVCFAAIGNWIAFGEGPRECSSTVSMFFLSSSRGAGDIECRIAFGIGAVIMDGMLIWGLGAGLTRVLGAGPVPGLIEKMGRGIVIACLMPFLLLMMSVVMARILADSLREYRRTGKWPRNEAFIARMKFKKKQT